MEDKFEGETYSIVFREVEEIVMAAIAACADWAIQGPFGQEERLVAEESTTNCMTRGIGAAGAAVDTDVDMARLKDLRERRGMAVRSVGSIR